MEYIEDIINTFTIQMLLFLISVVLIVNIILKNKTKWQKSENCKVCREGAVVLKRTISLHLMYIVFVLVLIIMLLFTYIAVKDDTPRNIAPSFYEYFSFGSVIVSIILAVLTIVYSYYTNSRSAGQSESINGSAEEIKKASGEVIQSSQQISNDSRNLTENIEKILNKLDEVGNTAKEAKEASSETNTILKEKSSIDIESPINNEINDSINKESDDKYVLEFIMRTSQFGKLILLGCKYSIETGKSFTVLQLFNEDREYMWGFLNATSAVKLIDFSVNESVFNITRINDIIKCNIEDIILNEDVDKDSDEKYNYEDFNRIKKYFGINK